MSAPRALVRPADPRLRRRRRGACPRRVWLGAALLALTLAAMMSWPGTDAEPIQRLLPWSAARPTPTPDRAAEGTRAGRPSDPDPGHGPALDPVPDPTLAPALARALAAAQRAAAAAGVPLRVISGRRTAQQQRRLFDEAVRTYGSVPAARRWVLPPELSRHVSGEAVDVGPAEGARWLEQHGGGFGLCRRYDNEWWHFEVLTRPGAACPAKEPNAGG